MKGFISYAHHDHQAFERICVHLRPLEHSHGIKFWVDKRIKAGDYWSKEIETAIEVARIHILLMSPDFFDSNYIMTRELPAIQAKYALGDLVLPVVIKRCCWPSFVPQLQAVPMSAQGRILPVDEWKPKENGFDAAREQLVTGIELSLGVKPKLPDWKRP